MNPTIARRLLALSLVPACGLNTLGPNDADLGTGGIASVPAATTGAASDPTTTDVITTDVTTTDVTTTDGTTTAPTTAGMSSTGSTGAPEPPAVCGDGELGGDEACDDGDQDNTDACVAGCSLARCGDLFVLAGVEACDDGNPIDTDACRSDCQLATCGDGVVHAGVEACDDGNPIDNDACSNTCELAHCGDGTLQPGEQCDDKNDVNEDACLNSCITATCGDGIVMLGGEQCDDAGASPQCNADCSTSLCGDGKLNPAAGEQCEDGNLVAGDGCAKCKTECGSAFASDWCLQAGTTQQFTRCESVTDSGKTCINPFIRYGSVEDGVPAKHLNNDLAKWCQQLGFAGFSGAVSYGNRPCLAPQGKLFGCAGYDENVWHWCDWYDGKWLDQTLDYHDCNDGFEITAITCQ